MKSLSLLSALSLFFTPMQAEDVIEEAFTHIYDKGIWGNGSGGGSDVKNAKPYLQFLQKFLRERNITSVVDAGCGDWQFSQFINWSGVRYIGFDVVQSVIQNNQARFAKPHISFVHGNAIEADLPEADLLLCKDVLQHLPNADVVKFCEQFQKFKYCLITNDFCSKKHSAVNHDLSIQDYKTIDLHRMIDLTAPPFNVRATKVLEYRSEGRIKQVLLVERK